MNRWIGVLLGGIVLATGCYRVSDTGYLGTWERGGQRAHSKISISKTGEQYHFHWSLDSADGKWTVRCDKDSHCVETLDGKKVSEYQFSTRVDPATGHLLVESHQQMILPKEKTQHDIDELIVEGNGLKLGSYTIERDGVTIKRGDGPKRFFDKVNNAIMEPAP